MMHYTSLFYKMLIFIVFVLALLTKIGHLCINYKKIFIYCSYNKYPLAYIQPDRLKIPP